ncbi:hypothetical protein GlitD10_2711 [Gloeomargarita lithophora Alchichica-D10]|uniref:Phospholipase D-like domain-containing protein n=1 Tax=Gloeomargarita lithophora Alchichica-D10 TaxID=1188229 RepID=A0A1J0AGJ3_9CYAN|nr:phospholipase D-like domain-containing protein [Gloeomargarita lithophora]APB35054.1 hypothetical protein GlitD10_2711 [Gloeomargarita lithophora Alchichica-D10]
MTRRTWLETTEYALVLVSLVGTVVAAVSQQVVLAALPMSLALLVNLIHRTQLEANQHQLLLTALESLNQRYGTDIKFLRRRLQDVLLLPESVNLTPLEHSLQELQQALGNLHQEMNQRLTSVEGLNLAPLQAKLIQLQEQYSTLRTGLGELTQNMAGLPQAQQVVQMEKGLEQLQRQAVQLQTQVQQLRQIPVVDVQPLEVQLQYLSQQITAPQALQTQIETIETATQRLQSAVERLGQDVSAALQVRETVGRLERELHTQSKLAPLVQQLEQKLGQVVSQYQRQERFTQAVAQELQQLQTQQAEIATWEPRLNQLEQQTQAVQELHDRVQELQDQTRTQVNRAALLPLVTAVERLHQQQTQHQHRLAPLATALANLQTELTQLQNAPEPAALSQVRSTLEHLTGQVGELSQGNAQQLQQVKQELTRTQAQLARLNDLPHLQQQLTEMAQLVSQIDHGHGDLRESTQTLASRQSQMEQQWQTTQTQLQQVPDQVATAIQDWATTINRQLRQLPNHTYELVADRFGGREILQQALTQTTQELIIVSPWLSQQTIDRPFLQTLRQLLAQGVRIRIGWGDVQDMKSQELSRNKRNQWREGPGRFSWKYNALGDLEQLEQEFPQHLHLKIIGTHEHYLVSDDQFALVGSHALLGGSGTSREVSLKTTDPRLIQDLRKRFQRAADLDDMNW